MRDGEVRDSFNELNAKIDKLQEQINEMHWVNHWMEEAMAARIQLLNPQEGEILLIDYSQLPKSVVNSVSRVIEDAVVAVRNIKGGVPIFTLHLRDCPDIAVETEKQMNQQGWYRKDEADTKCGCSSKQCE